jgi:hypothetical protein
LEQLVGCKAFAYWYPPKISGGDIVVLSMELLSNSLWQIELKLFDEKGKVTEPEEIFLL